MHVMTQAGFIDELSDYSHNFPDKILEFPDHQSAFALAELFEGGVVCLCYSVFIFIGAELRIIYLLLNVLDVCSSIRYSSYRSCRIAILFLIFQFPKLNSIVEFKGKILTNKPPGRNFRVAFVSRVHNRYASTCKSG